MSSRRNTSIATDMGKSQDTKNIIWLTKWWRNAKNSFHGIHDRFLRDHEFRVRMIEHNRDEEVCRRWDVLACRWRSHFSFFRKKNASTTNTNGGSIPISRVLTPYHWEIVLISSKCCLPWNDCNKKLEKNHTCLLPLASTKNGSWHRFHLLHGGIDKIPGDFQIKKVKEEASKVLRVNGETCCLRCLASFFGKDFLEFNLLCYRWIVCSWRWSTVSVGCVKTTLQWPVLAVWIKMSIVRGDLLLESERSDLLDRLVRS